MRFHPHTRRTASRSGERGYILLTLLLMMALMAIAALATVPTLKFNMRRDREEEMIHRGVQYSNAIRRYYKKFGRYPTKLEDLESSNNVRFLRKRYKDPMNCKAGKCEDFKLLHFGDVQMSISGFGGGAIPGAVPAGAAGSASSPSAFGQSSSSVQNSSFGGNSSFGQNSSFGGNSSFGANSSFGQNQQATGNQPLGSDPTQNGGQNSASSPSGTGGDNGTASSSGSSGSSSGSNPIGSGQIIGGPIVGVASGTKDTDPTIREFNHKKKYKDWMFVYDPAQDQGRLIRTPYQPQLQGIGQQGMQNVNGVNGGAGSGQPLPGMQNNPNLPGSGGFGNSNQPSNPPQ